MSETTIHDLLYFDFEKASSIWSQFQWGQSQSITTTQDENVEKKLKGSAGFQNYIGFSAEKGHGEKTSIIETKIMHHDLLNRVVALLSDAGLVVDLTRSVNKEESSPDNIRSAIGQKPYIRATGWSALEDYRRILSITEKLPEILDYITYIQIENLKKIPEYAQLEQQISEKRKEVNRLKDRNVKAVEEAKLDALEKNLGGIIGQGTSAIDPKLLDMLKLFINTFMPNRINFRVYPFVQSPSFQVLCNLKRECFVDQDLEHLLYGYGNRPNVQLSVFGLITSLPPKENTSFDPLDEFKSEVKGSEQVEFEKGIRALFPTIDTFESFMRYSRYPNITIHPIAVYRDFSNVSEIVVTKEESMETDNVS
jgi:hypothetical protein